MCESKNKNIQNIWQEYKVWLEENHSNKTYIETFANGTTINEINSLEKIIKVDLDDNLKASLLIHDGVTDLDFFLNADLLLSTKQILNSYNIAENILIDELQGIGLSIKDFNKFNDYNKINHKDDYDYDLGIKLLPFSPKWIPFMSSNGGDVIWYIDMDPDVGGTLGQIIEYYAEGAEAIIVATTYIEFFYNNLQQLVAGNYVYDSYGYLTEKENLEEVEKEIAQNALVGESISLSLDLDEIETMDEGELFTVTGMLTCENFFIDEINEFKGALKELSFIDKIRFKAQEMAAAKITDNECFIFMDDNEYLIVNISQKDDVSKVTPQSIVKARIKISKKSLLKSEYSLIDYELLKDSS